MLCFYSWQFGHTPNKSLKSWQNKPWGVCAVFLDIAIRTLLFVCLAGSDPGASSYMQQEYPVNNNPKWSKIYPWLSMLQLAEFFCKGKANNELNSNKLKNLTITLRACKHFSIICTQSTVTFSLKRVFLLPSPI